MNRVSLICLLDINVGCKFEKREKKKKLHEILLHTLYTSI